MGFAVWFEILGAGRGVPRLTSGSEGLGQLHAEHDPKLNICISNTT
jgi:hypothetical protein